MFNQPISSPVLIGREREIATFYPREALAADENVLPTRGGFPGFTLAPKVRSKEDVDMVLRQAQQAGASLTKPAAETDWGGYAGYFQDPDGYLWEVAWNPHFWIE